MEQTKTVGEENIIKTTRTTTPVTPAIKVDPPQKTYETKKVIFRTYQIIWYILGIVEVVLGFRMLLKIFGANPSSGFTNLIYTISDPLALPFAGIFNVSVSQGSVFEWSTLVAGIVYFLVAYGIMQMMQIIKPTTPHEVETSV